MGSNLCQLCVQRVIFHDFRGNRIAVSIFFDEYENQAAGLEAIRGDAENIRKVLEDELKFRYMFPSESDPTLFEVHQFENQGKLVSTFKEFLKTWTERQPKGTVLDTFLLYVHGHSAQQRLHRTQII